MAQPQPGGGRQLSFLIAYPEQALLEKSLFCWNQKVSKGNGLCAEEAICVYNFIYFN